jgi:hypothetical protein
MPTLPKGAIGLSDLINRVKQDLLSEQAKTGADLFSIDEVTIELSFVVNGDIDSGFSLGVITLGSQVSEERIQKISLKLTPIMPKQQVIESLGEEQAHMMKAMQAKTLFRDNEYHQGER